MNRDCLRTRQRLPEATRPVGRGVRLALLGAGALVALSLAACESDSPATGAGPSSAGNGGSGASTTGAGGDAGSAGGEPTGGSGGHAPTLHESEPNDGAADDDYDDLALGHRMLGAIEPGGDTDIFRLPTAPGTVLEARLTPAAGSTLEPHLTVIDDGRGGEQEGGDYVKIARAPSGELRLQWLAMGEGGYYVIVRDGRNVDGESVGGAGFGYALDALVIDRAAVTVGALPVSAPHADTLPFGGAIQLYDFTATAWQEATIDLQAAGDLDGRLTVFAEATSDWIARNDDRSDTDVDPLIDAPLTEGGPLLLVVENVAESAASLGYELGATL